MSPPDSSLSQPAISSQGDLPTTVPSVAGSQITNFQVSVEQAVQLATQQFEQGKRADAESICLQILASEPEQPDALHICGALAHLAGKNGIALALLEKAARLAPSNHQVQYNLGVVYGALRHYDRAIAQYQKTLALAPNHVNAMQNLGNIALESEDYVQALRCYEGALSIQPDGAILHLSMAMTWTAQRVLDKARASFERALALDPSSVRIQWEAGQLFLLLGEFERGWDYYEARFPAGNDCKVWNYPFGYPRWEGESLRGRHLLVHGEQGLGDEIMFLSIVPELIAEGADITIVGQPHLHSLWKQVFPDSSCFVQLRANEDAWTKVAPEWLPQLGHTTPPVDYQIPFGSLARIRRRHTADFAKQQPYIRPDPLKVAQWTDRLDRALPPRQLRKRLRVGLVWAGNPAHNNAVANRKDAKRSLSLSEFFVLQAMDGVDWVSLQTWQAAQQVREAQDRFTLLDCSESLTDFHETAALIDNLDLVISVDTSVCHLSAAVGTPVWILLPFIGEWRWGLDETHAHWWPNARLFRQQTAGDWSSVVRRVGEALKELSAQPIDEHHE